MAQKANEQGIFPPGEISKLVLAEVYCGVVETLAPNEARWGRGVELMESIVESSEEGLSYPVRGGIDQ